MQPFTTLTAIAAGVPIANIDTDMLFPASFLTTVSREGLGDALFNGLRRDPAFPLNHAPWDRAGILVTLDNLGCGSSREHAPWALLDFGIRCVIAPSFADIFYVNCCKNGILPIALAQAQVEILLADAADPATALLTVDLANGAITRANGETIGFAIDPQRRERLLKGLDDIDATLAFADDIGRHEAEAPRLQPWLRPIPEILP